MADETNSWKPGDFTWETNAADRAWGSGLSLEEIQAEIYGGSKTAQPTADVFVLGSGLNQTASDVSVPEGSADALWPTPPNPSVDAIDASNGLASTALIQLMEESLNQVAATLSAEAFTDVEATHDPSWPRQRSSTSNSLQRSRSRVQSEVVEIARQTPAGSIEIRFVPDAGASADDAAAAVEAFAAAVGATADIAEGEAEPRSGRKKKKHKADSSPTSDDIPSPQDRPSNGRRRPTSRKIDTFIPGITRDKNGERTPLSRMRLSLSGKHGFRKDDIHLPRHRHLRLPHKVVLGGCMDGGVGDDEPTHELIQRVLAAERKKLQTAITSRAHDNDLRRVSEEAELLMSDGSANHSKLFSGLVWLAKASGQEQFFGVTVENKAGFSSQALTDSSSYFLGKITPFKWIVTILSAFVIAAEAAIIQFFNYNITQWRVKTIDTLSISGPGGYWFAFAYMLALAMPAMLLISYLVTYHAPHASGSGIVEVTAFLNGMSMPMGFTFKAWFTRASGIVLAASTGMFIGTLGPASHLGAMLSLFTVKVLQCRGSSRWQVLLNGHKNQCELVAAGAAMGIAAGFGAPVGGLLFSFDEVTLYWGQRLTWRTFVGTFLAAVLGKLFYSGFKTVGTAGFIEFPYTDVNYHVWELWFFAFLSLFTGVMGAAFCFLITKIAALRRKVFRMGAPTKFTRRMRLVEVQVIVIVTMALCLWPAVLLGCRDMTPVVKDEDVIFSSRVIRQGPPILSGGICPENTYSDVAYIFLKPKEKSIKALYSERFAGGAYLSIGGLAICYFVTFFMTAATFGSAIPCGLFVPNVVAGGCLGRIFGQVLLNGGLDVNPGLYALMGSAGALAGFSRMTISVAVIFLEITNDTDVLLPLMLVIFGSKAIADYFGPSVVVGLLRLNPAVNLLEDCLSEDNILVAGSLNVHDICTTTIVGLQEFHTLRQIARLLLTSGYATYPIIDRCGKLLGVTSRVQLACLLERERYYATTQDTTFSVLSGADITPDVWLWNSPASRVAHEFIACGLQSLYVVDKNFHVVGVLTRTDVSKLCRDDSAGIQGIRNLVNRKRIAVESGAAVVALDGDPPVSATSSDWGNSNGEESSNEGGTPTNGETAVMDIASEPQHDNSNPLIDVEEEHVLHCLSEPGPDREGACEPGEPPHEPQQEPHHQPLASTFDYSYHHTTPS